MGQEQELREENPYIVPPFDGGLPRSSVKYVWWSWHPLYPYWSKSCWKAPSIEEAQKLLASNYCSSMHYYHNKLILEDGLTLTEVLDVPCPKLAVWQGMFDRGCCTPLQRRIFKPELQILKNEFG